MVLPLGDSHRTGIVPVVTYSLIALNVVMFLAQLREGKQFTTAYAATPYEITHNEDIDQPITLRVPEEESPAGLDGHAPLGTEVIEQGPVPFPVWLTLFTA